MRNEDTDSDEENIDRSWEIAETPPSADLLPLLECPVCFNLPLPPIRTCHQGHTICASCSQKLSRCPLCQKPIGIGRNFFAEDFVNKSVIKCKYARDGCTLRLQGDRLQNHFKACCFRPVKCRRCNARITFRDFENHLYACHAVGRWDLNDDGVRTILSEMKETGRFDVDLTEVFPRKAVYKALIAALAISFLADQLFLNS